LIKKAKKIIFLFCFFNEKIKKNLNFHKKLLKLLKLYDKSPLLFSQNR